MRLSVLLLFISLFFVVSCRNTPEASTSAEPDERTPVTVTNPSFGKLTDAISLNATSKFLMKTAVKSDINGYLQKVEIRLGQRVTMGQELFVVRSKESEHLGNAISGLDSSLHFTGLVSIKSPSPGFITELSYQAGDYVQDNEVLATISDLNSLVFLLEIPYELNSYIVENKNVELTLPGGKKLVGSIESSLPAVDPVSQTQSCIIHVQGISTIPENLVATVKFVRVSKGEGAILPKEAILTDETQSEFWIMKMADSTTAIKVPVTIGLETSDKVEILTPVLTSADQILLTGNYGLPDSSKVIIQNKN